MQNGQATVNVVVRGTDSLQAYRQARFYQRTATGWIQSAPIPALWGPERQLETPSMIFHYQAQDFAAVVATAVKMERFYTEMSHNVGLPLRLGSEKLKITISLDEQPGYAISWKSRTARLHDRTIQLASPALYQAPVALSAADILRQTLAFYLIEQVLYQAQTRYALTDAAQSFINALYLWQLWQLDLPLARWRPEIIHWLYQELPATTAQQTFVLPMHYAEMCAEHRLWVESPLYIQIPFVCVPGAWERDYWAAWQYRSALTELADIALWLDYSAQHSPELHHPGTTVALATILDYAVVTYGAERLPALLASVNQYNRWDEELIRTVYGVSYAEFEQGWQAYMAEEYKLSAVFPVGE